MDCSKPCLKKSSFRDDDLTRAESDCLNKCFHKHYRYLAYANTLYTYLVSDGAVDKFIDG